VGSGQLPKVTRRYQKAVEGTPPEDVEIEVTMPVVTGPVARVVEPLEEEREAADEPVE